MNYPTQEHARKLKERAEHYRRMSHDAHEKEMKLISQHYAGKLDGLLAALEILGINLDIDC
jgi:UDP-N-acetylmuramyl pentapeptide synthase